MDLEPWDPLEHPARIEVRRQESDDSDAEGGLGNVTRIVLRPPGHSGKAKRGHLCFDASFECGNLGRVDFISEFEYDLFIRPDTCNPRYRLWFNFVVDNVRTDQRVIFNVVNLCKVKTLFRDGMTPLVKTSSRPKWQRLPEKYVYYHKSPEHRNHYILSFAFAFDREEDVYQFAFSFPFSYSRCQAHLNLLERKELGFCKRETIATSLQNRKVEAITFTNIGTTASAPPKRPKLVVLMARSHPGESPTSFVSQGFMDFLSSSHPMMMALRDYVIIKVLPMINPDGVFLGNYRCSLMGYDLNRHWNSVNAWSHPTLNAVKNYLLELDANKGFDLDMVIDMHAHSSLTGAFIYGNSYDDVYRFERHILFPKLFTHNAEDFNTTNTMYNRDSNKSGTARRHLCEILKSSVNTYTVEVSFHGFTQQSTNQFVTYNEDGYFRLGRNLARTLFEYYRVTGVILTSLVQAPSAKSSGDHHQDGKKPQRRKSRSRSRSQPRSKAHKLKHQKGKKSRQETTTDQSQEILDGESIPEQRIKSEILRKSSERSLSQEKAILQLSQLTQEAHRESSESTDESGHVHDDDDDGDDDPSHHRPRYPYTNAEGPVPSGHYLTTKLRDGVTITVLSGASDSDPEHHPSPVRDNVRVKRKSVETRNQLRAARKTAAYQTFDFSTIKAFQSGIYSRSFRYKGRERAPGRVGGRKIGGGGVVGQRLNDHSFHQQQQQRRRRQHAAENKNNAKGWHSEPEGSAPFLTIIDFNMLIHKGLRHHPQKLTSAGWKGFKVNSKRWTPSSATTGNLDQCSLVSSLEFRSGGVGIPGGFESDKDVIPNTTGCYPHLSISPILKSPYGQQHKRRRRVRIVRGTASDGSARAEVEYLQYGNPSDSDSPADSYSSDDNNLVGVPAGTSNCFTCTTLFLNNNT